jgi:hypothetical protein
LQSHQPKGKISSGQRKSRVQVGFISSILPNMNQQLDALDELYASTSALSLVEVRNGA